MAYLGGTKEEEDVIRVSEEIIGFLKLQDGSVSQKSIEEAIEGATTHKRKALRNLFEKGAILRSGGGKRGDPYLYSCSLVPNIYTGREKQETQPTENPNDSSILSRSHDSMDFAPQGQANPEKEGNN